MIWVSTGRNGEGAARGALLWLVLGLYVQGNRAVTGSSRAVPASVKPGKAALPGSQQRREPELLRSPSAGPGASAAAPGGAGRTPPRRGRELPPGLAPSGAPAGHRRPPRPLGAGEGAFPEGFAPGLWGRGGAARERAFAGERGRPEASNAGRGGKQKRGSPLNRFLRSNGSRGEGLDWKSKFQDTDQSALWRPRTV